MFQAGLAKFCFPASAFFFFEHKHEKNALSL